ncbi:hypothetical protein [Enterobacter cloacae]|uniref:hypothetical protein n=1 Tax=Enterobacter cloacae TaxID=550 RepID=UPI003A8F0090
MACQAADNVILVRSRFSLYDAQSICSMHQFLMTAPLIYFFQGNPIGHVTEPWSSSD